MSMHVKASGLCCDQATLGMLHASQGAHRPALGRIGCGGT